MSGNPNSDTGKKAANAKKAIKNSSFRQQIVSATTHVPTDSERRVNSGDRINFAELLIAIPSDFEFERDRTPLRGTKL